GCGFENKSSASSEIFVTYRQPARKLFRAPGRRNGNYLISTLAPAASIFFLISSASALVTPSLIVLGAPSTSAFASARPRPGTALRTSLITPILFAPISFRMTSKAVFSSAAAGAAPPPAPAEGAATAATGAAALTPHFSSSCFTRPAISRTVRPLSCSTIVFVSAILFSSHAPPSEASEELRPAAAEPDVIFGCSLCHQRRREICWFLLL